MAQIPKVYTPDMAYTMALYGWVLLKAASVHQDAAGANLPAGQSPEGTYVAIIPLEDPTTLGAITYAQDDLYTYGNLEDITDVPLSKDVALPCLFTQVTVTAGSVLLIKG